MPPRAERGSRWKEPTREGTKRREKKGRLEGQEDSDSREIAPGRTFAADKPGRWLLSTIMSPIFVAFVIYQLARVWLAAIGQLSRPVW